MTLVLRSVKGTPISADEYDSTVAFKHTDTGHGLAIGDLVRLDSGASQWVKAQADSFANRASGVVVFVPDANNAWVATRDGTVFTWTAHGKGATGTRLFLSQGTAGDSGADPVTGVIQECLVVIDANTMMLHYGRLEEI